MNTQFRLRLFAVAAPLAVLTACGGEAGDDATAPAASDEPAVIEERQENFEAIGDAFKAIRSQLEGDTPDTAAILAAATDINERAASIEGHFPEGTGVDAGYDTEALATIWEKPAEFAAARQKLIDESAKMVELASAGDVAAIGEQVQALGGSCKGCHDQFRLDDD